MMINTMEKIYIRKRIETIGGGGVGATLDAVFRKGQTKGGGYVKKRAGQRDSGRNLFVLRSIAQSSLDLLCIQGFSSRPAVSRWFG